MSQFIQQSIGTILELETERGQSFITGRVTIDFISNGDFSKYLDKDGNLNRELLSQDLIRYFQNDIFQL